MLRYFRRLRQKLLDEGNFKRYVKYATGEVLLIVIGILVALQINNWNESRKEQISKEHLINELLLELHSVEQMLGSKMAQCDTLHNAANTILLHLGEETLTVSTDSLRNLAYQALRGLGSLVSFPVYEEAKFSGKLSLLDNRNILDLYSDTERLIKMYDDYRNFPTGRQEIRKKLGSEYLLATSPPFSSIPFPERFRMSETTYKEIIMEKDTYALFFSIRLYRFNQLRFMKTMEKNIEELTKILQEL